VNDTSRFNILRLRYKAAFDAYQALANRNAQLLINGRTLSEQQRVEEERAAADLQSIRDQLMASTSRFGQ